MSFLLHGKYSWCSGNYILNMMDSAPSESIKMLTSSSLSNGKETKLNFQSGSYAEKAKMHRSKNSYWKTASFIFFIKMSQTCLNTKTSWYIEKPSLMFGFTCFTCSSSLHHVPAPVVSAFKIKAFYFLFSHWFMRTDVTDDEFLLWFVLFQDIWGGPPPPPDFLVTS